MKKIILGAAAGIMLSTAAHAVSFDFGGASGDIVYTDTGTVINECTYDHDLERDAYWAGHSQSHSAVVDKYLGYANWYRSKNNTSPYALAKICYLYNAYQNDAYTEHDVLSLLSLPNQHLLLTAYHEFSEEDLEMFLMNHQYAMHAGVDSFQALWDHVLYVVEHNVTAWGLPGMDYNIISYTPEEVAGFWNDLTDDERVLAIDAFPGNSDDIALEEWVHDMIEVPAYS